MNQSNRRALLAAQSEERAAQALMDMGQIGPRSKAGIVVETRAEKIERKVLAQERRQERLVEQKKIAQHMEHLMEKVMWWFSIVLEDGCWTVNTPLPGPTWNAIVEDGWK